MLFRFFIAVFLPPSHSADLWEIVNSEHFSSLFLSQLFLVALHFRRWGQTTAFTTSYVKADLAKNGLVYTTVCSLLHYMTWNVNDMVSTQSEQCCIYITTNNRLVRNYATVLMQIIKVKLQLSFGDPKSICWRSRFGPTDRHLLTIAIPSLSTDIAPSCILKKHCGDMLAELPWQRGLALTILTAFGLYKQNQTYQ